MATNIPPHNLNELLTATIALIKDPKISDAALFKIIPAPDFPTGGEIRGNAGAMKLYSTGSGSVTIRAKTHIETNKRSAIIVTEIPYMVNKVSSHLPTYLPL